MGLVEGLGNFCGVCLVEGGLFLKFYKNTRHTAQKTSLNPNQPSLNLLENFSPYNQPGIRSTL